MKYADDPQYQAFLNSMGFNQSEATRTAADSRQQVANQYDYSAEGIDIDRQRALDNILGNFENRGLVRSGDHEVTRAEALRDSNRRLGALELQTANRFGTIADQMASEQARLDMQEATARYGAAGRAGRAAGG